MGKLVDSPSNFDGYRLCTMGLTDPMVNNAAPPSARTPTWAHSADNDGDAQLRTVHPVRHDICEARWGAVAKDGARARFAKTTTRIMSMRYAPAHMCWFARSRMALRM